MENINKREPDSIKENTPDTKLLKLKIKSNLDSILKNKSIEEITELFINYLKSGNYEGIISLIDENFDTQDGNIIINHGNFYKDISGRLQRKYVINLYKNKEQNLKKILYLIENIFGEMDSIDNILINFIDDNMLKNIILNGNFDFKIHDFKLIKKETK